MKGPSGDQGAEPPKALVFFNIVQRKNNIFNANLHRHEIVNIDLGRFSTWGGSNNCERSEQTERLCEAFTGVQGAGPLAGVARGQRPLKTILYLQAKYAYFQALCGLNLQKYVILGLQEGS